MESDQESPAVVAAKPSPFTILATLVAVLHALASTAFVVVFLNTPIGGPNGGVKVDMFYQYGMLSLLMLSLGVTFSAIAAGWRRKALLVACNFVPMAWIFVEVPPLAIVELFWLLLT